LNIGTYNYFDVICLLSTQSGHSRPKLNGR
jgi:hypothetical protein